MLPSMADWLVKATGSEPPPQQHLRTPRKMLGIGNGESPAEVTPGSAQVVCSEGDAMAASSTRSPIAIGNGACASSILRMMASPAVPLRMREKTSPFIARTRLLELENAPPGDEFKADADALRLEILTTKPSEEGKTNLSPAGVFY